MSFWSARPRYERARRKFEEISDFSPLRVGDFFSDHDAAECFLQESLAGRGALPEEETDSATTQQQQAGQVDDLLLRLGYTENEDVDSVWSQEISSPRSVLSQ